MKEYKSWDELKNASDSKVSVFLKKELGLWYGKKSKFIEFRKRKATTNCIGELAKKALQSVLSENSNKVYPAPCDVFRIFRECSENKVKVVILGQDPYPNPGQADGFCFSTKNWTTRRPLSLIRIFTLLFEKENVQNIKSGDLSGWVSQGVFLLNTALTVEEGKPKSHKSIWQNFSRCVLSYLKENTNCLFILWGKEAREITKQFELPDDRCKKTVHPRVGTFCEKNDSFLWVNEKGVNINWRKGLF